MELQKVFLSSSKCYKPTSRHPEKFHNRETLAVRVGAADTATMKVRNGVTGLLIKADGLEELLAIVAKGS
jgi:hypothetical protein